MPRVTVVPVIGQVVRSRLESLRGCHALDERGVTKSFQNPEEMAAAITDALHEIALSEAAGRSRFNIDEMTYLLKFKL